MVPSHKGNMHSATIRWKHLDEQEAMMNLFKGIVGIRNKKAHTNVILDNPVRATEYLSLASLLMRLLDQFAV